MGTLTFAQYKTRVRAILDNMPSDDPVVTSGILDSAVNNAANRLVRLAFGGNGKNIDLFPEHINNSWTIGPTVVGDNRFSVPENCIAVHELHYPDTDQSSDPGDWSEVGEKIVGKSNVITIGLMNKETTIADFPRIWARKANDILYHPTTRTGYTTYVRLYGIAEEVPLTADGETFRINRKWDSAICDLAAEEIARKMPEMLDRAGALLAGVQRQMEETSNISSLSSTPMAVESVHTPTRFTVYGGLD